MPVIHCIDEFYYEWRVIQSIQTRWTTKWAHETPWGRAAWLEMNDGLRLLSVLFWSAGHRQDIYTHVSHINHVSWPNGRTLLAFWPCFIWFLPFQHGNTTTSPLQSNHGLDWREEKATHNLTKSTFGRNCPNLNATLRRRGHLLPPRWLIVFKDFSINDNRAFAVFKLNHLSKYYSS